jgi:hypothetical protein
MAGKRQLKELLIVTKTEGTKSAAEDLGVLNTELDKLQGNIGTIGKAAPKIVKSLSSIRKQAQPIGEAFTAATKGLNAFQNATKGNLKGAKEHLQAYIDGLELTTIFMKELGDEALRTAGAMQGLAQNDTLTTLSRLDSTLNSIETILSDIHVDLSMVEDNTREATRGFDRLEDSIEANVTQTKKLRKGNQGLFTGLRDTETQARKTAKGVEGLARANGRAAKHQGKLASGMPGVAAGYAVIAANVYALSETFRVLGEAQAFERLQENLVTFSAAVSGINVRGLAEDMSKLSGSVVSVRESMGFATKGAAFGFTTEQMERLTVGARKASIALGRDFTDSMDRVTRGISKQEIELFDELGVVTRLTPAFEKYAKKVNKSVVELNDFERQTALANEVLLQLETRFSGVSVSASAIEKVNTAVANLKDTTLIAVARGLEPMLDTIESIATFLNPVSGQVKLLSESLETMEIASKSVESLGIAVTALAESYKYLSGATDEVKTNQEELLEQADDLTGYITSFSTYAVGAAIGIAVITAAVWKLAAAVTAATAGMNLLVGLGVGIASLGVGMLGVGAEFEDRQEAQEKYRKSQEVVLNAAKKQAKTEEMLAKDGVDIAKLRKEAEEEALWAMLAAQKKFIDAKISGDEEMIASAELGMTQVATAAEIYSNKLLGIGTEMQTVRSGVEEAFSELTSLAQKSAKQISPFTKVLDQLASATQKSSVGDLASESALAAEEFEKLSKSAGLSTSIKDADELKSLMEELHSEALSMSQDLDTIAIKSRGAGLNAVEQAEELLKHKSEFLEKAKLAGDLTATEVDALQEEVTLAKLKLGYDKESLRVSKSLEALENAKRLLQAKQSAIYVSASDQLKQQKMYLEGMYAIKMAKQGLDEVELARLRDKLQIEKDILDAQIQQAELREATEAKLATKASEHEANRLLDFSTGPAAEARRNAEDVALERESLEIMKASGIYSEIEISNLERIVKAKEKLATLQTNKVPLAEAEQTLQVLQQLDGLSKLQTSFAQAGELASKFGQDLMNFGGSLTNLMEQDFQSFADFTTGIANVAVSVLGELSNERIAAIDREIAAEKRRDGKSAESLARIKKLQAKKIKEEAKTQKAQLGMSTATGIMNIWAGPMGKYPPAALAMSGVVAALGMKQLSNIDKAANGQLAALDSGGGPGASITAGNRENNIDVSKAASAGEYAFVTGGAGTWNGPGRAGGGTAGAGTSFIAGERGPEIITPQVPVNVSDASDSKVGSKIVFAPVFNAQAVDTEGMEQLFQRYGRELYDGLEEELLARNLTLENLER